MSLYTGGEGPLLVLGPSSAAETTLYYSPLAPRERASCYAWACWLFARHAPGTLLPASHQVRARQWEPETECIA